VSQNKASNTTGRSIGLIAGDRLLPLVFARQARKSGIDRIVAAAFEGETSQDLASLVDEIVWMRVGQLSKLISTFTDRGITQCVMAGRIAPKNLYDLRPDLRALAVLLKLKEKNAHTIFGAIADELQKDGVELVAATPWMKELMPGSGFHLGPKLSSSQLDDVRFGAKIAREISRLEIGQVVVMKEGTVLAVEGLEGTDGCLARGGALAGKSGGAVAVKLAKPGHDMRFDIPCLGPTTIECCARSGINVLAFEAGQSLLLEPEKCAELVGRHKISLITFD
jgi:DUF1009 family protein